MCCLRFSNYFRVMSGGLKSETAKFRMMEQRDGEKDGRPVMMLLNSYQDFFNLDNPYFQTS